MYKFTVIAESRKNESQADLEKWVKAIQSKLEQLEGVKLTKGTWPNYCKVFDFPDNSRVWKCYLQVAKHTRKTTWNDVFGAINSVKVCSFDRVKAIN